MLSKDDPLSFTDLKPLEGKQREKLLGYSSLHVLLYYQIEMKQ